MDVYEIVYRVQFAEVFLDDVLAAWIIDYVKIVISRLFTYLPRKPKINNIQAFFLELNVNAPFSTFDK